MRILWHSGAPWAPTGYGNQTALFTTRIAGAGHDVAISATWGLNGSALEWEGMQVFPSDDQWGNVLMPHLASKYKSDLVITLMDVWVLRNLEAFRKMNMACWVPVDHQPCPPNVARFFKATGARPVAMSKFGEQMLKDEGLDPLYVPHGVDTNVFKPLTHDRGEVRRSMGLPADAFIVGMVANNHGHTPPRKAFPQAVMAFAAFREKHPDALLYLHSEITGQRSGANSGLNLPALCEQFDIPASAVAFAPQVEMEIGIPAESMAAMYGSMDILLNPSYGEGFGIPIIEAQACGTPVIVTDWTAMPELCGAGWKVSGEPWWDPQHGAFFMAPFVGDIIAALEDAYDRAAGLRAGAREFALRYDADRVMAEHWLPTLKALSRPREVAPLTNRAMRRAAAKQKVPA
jgi:glycosyltransferase involved in cell wall biosynthesis